jgi:Zn(II)-responsive transcriptional regulator
MSQATIKAGEVAKQASVNVETLRYYEQEGLLPEPARSDSGYRLYGQEAVKTVRFIKRSQDLGFSLSEIKELLALRHHPDQSAKEVKALTEHKISVIEGKIQALQAMRDTLRSLAEACPGSSDTIAHCPIIHCLDDSSL